MYVFAFGLILNYLEKLRTVLLLLLFLKMAVNPKYVRCIQHLMNKLYLLVILLHYTGLG